MKTTLTHVLIEKVAVAAIAGSGPLRPFVVIVVWAGFSGLRAIASFGSSFGRMESRHVQQQIPFGNDNKKNKCKSKSRATAGPSTSFPLVTSLRMKSLF